MNVFKEMALSIYDYGSYSQFLKNKKGKVFGFGVLLLTIYFVLTMILPGILSGGALFRLGDIINESMPDFSLKNGYLWVDDVIEYDIGTTYIYINTNSSLVLEEETISGFDRYSNVIIADNEMMLVKNEGDWYPVVFSALEFELDKSDLLSYVPFLYVIIAVFMLFAYIWMLALFFFGVLFVALIGMIIASFMRYQLTFGQLYLMGVYSRTLSLLIKAIVSYLPFGIPYFWVLNFGLSALIIGLAIMKMKNQTPETPASTPYSGFNM